MGDGGRKVEIAGAEDTENEDDTDVEGALEIVGADDVDGVGIDLTGCVLAPREKMSTTGTVDFEGCVDDEGRGFERPWSSMDMFALPFLREVGTNAVDGPGTSVGPSTSPCPTSLALASTGCSSPGFAS